MTNKPLELEEPLQDLKAANRRLRRAISQTIRAWPYTPRCWIDAINEPTIILAKHRLPAGK